MPGPLDLGVDDDPLGHLEVGARVHVDVAVARRGVDHRHARDGADRLLQALAAARDDQVDDALLSCASSVSSSRPPPATSARQPSGSPAPVGRLARDPRQHGVGVRAPRTSRAAAPRCPTSGTARRRRSSRSAAPRRRRRSRRAGLEPCGTRARWPGARRRRPRRPGRAAPRSPARRRRSPRTRASSSASRSISAAERPDSRPASRSRALASRISGDPRLERVGDGVQRARPSSPSRTAASRRAAALAAQREIGH